MSKPLSVLQQEAKALNINVVEILSTVERMYSGWESDTEGWIVKLDDGKIIGLSTNHGSICRWSQKEMQDDLEEGRKFVSGVHNALTLIGAHAVKPDKPVKERALMLVRQQRGGFAESMATETGISATMEGLCRWVQENFGRDSTASGSGHMTLMGIRANLKVSEAYAEDSRSPNWKITRSVYLFDQQVGFVNIENLHPEFTSIVEPIGTSRVGKHRGSKPPPWSAP